MPSCLCATAFFMTVSQKSPSRVTQGKDIVMRKRLSKNSASKGTVLDNTTNSITGLSVDITSLTFAKFKALVSSTEGMKLPTVKALRESGTQVLALVKTKDGALTVFRNGFFMYETKSGHATVYAVDRCARIVLSPMNNDEASVLDETNFGDCPWPKVLEFAASERIANNINRDARRQEVLSLDIFDEDYDTRLTVQPEMEIHLEEEDVSMEESERLRAALAQLTKRQREVIRFYYFDGLTQEEIASQLGVSRPYITKTLNRAIEILRKGIET